MDGLTVGRVVHYSLGELNADCRAAIVQRVLNRDLGWVELHVFWNAFDTYLKKPETNQVRFSAIREKHTWHWIENT